MPKIDIPDGWLESHPYRYTPPKFESTKHTRVVREEVLKPTTSRALAAAYNPKPHEQPTPEHEPEPTPVTSATNPPNTDPLITKIRIKILIALSAFLIISLYISAAHPSGRDNIALGLGMTGIILGYMWFTGPGEHLFPETETELQSPPNNAFQAPKPVGSANNSSSVESANGKGKDKAMVAHQSQTNQLWRKEVTYKLERMEVLRLVPETRADVAVVGDMERLGIGQ